MSLFNAIFQNLVHTKVEAHCDIPCGIYDPHLAQVAAHTVVRMVDLMEGLDKSAADYNHKFSRYVTTKEEHAELAKHEIRIIWGDFIKSMHLKSQPGLGNLVWEIMQKGSAARQNFDKASAKALLDAVLDFSEKFWMLKGKTPRRVMSNFPSGGEIVLPE